MSGTLGISAVVIDLQIENNNGRKLDKDGGNRYYPSEDRIELINELGAVPQHLLETCQCVQSQSC